MVSPWIHIRIHQDTCILDWSSRSIRIHRYTKSRYMCVLDGIHAGYSKMKCLHQDTFPDNKHTQGYPQNSITNAPAPTTSTQQTPVMAPFHFRLTKARQVNRLFPAFPRNNFPHRLFDNEDKRSTNSVLCENEASVTCARCCPSRI